MVSNTWLSLKADNTIDLFVLCEQSHVVNLSVTVLHQSLSLSAISFKDTGLFLKMNGTVKKENVSYSNVISNVYEYLLWNVKGNVECLGPSLS